ncbi:MAG: DUF1524 domain-containing protein [Dehalococcoidia bacterium]
MAAYDRDDWQHWIDANGDCQNTRAEVLIAESAAAVTFTAASGGCTVATGLWQGPFTGQAFTAASDVDVDHMVPLKNAHDSGAWSWSAAQKRDYANELSDPQHLIAVDDGTNQSKGAHGPEAWKPPLQSYWCRYAVDWIGIKSRWDQTATDAEWSALLVMLSTCPGGSLTVLPAATVAPTPTATATPAASCDPSYPTVCIPPFPPDLNCGDIAFRRFTVLPPDPHRFDGDQDGVGCES